MMIVRQVYPFDGGMVAQIRTLKPVTLSFDKGQAHCPICKPVAFARSARSSAIFVCASSIMPSAFQSVRSYLAWSFDGLLRNYVECCSPSLLRARNLPQVVERRPRLDLRHPAQPVLGWAVQHAHGPPGRRFLRRLVQPRAVEHLDQAAHRHTGDFVRVSRGSERRTFGSRGSAFRFSSTTRAQAPTNNRCG